VSLYKRALECFDRLHQNGAAGWLGGIGLAIAALELVVNWEPKVLFWGVGILLMAINRCAVVAHLQIKYDEKQ